MAAGEAWINVEVGQVLAETNDAQGDCLFLALSRQLEGQFSSLQLREMAVNYLSDHRGQFEAEIISLGWDMIESGELDAALAGDILVDAVLNVLSNPHTWGGAECLAALSMALNRGIRVYQEDGPTINFPEGEHQLLRVVLRYPTRHGQQRRTHYESVLHWRPEPANPAQRADSSNQAANAQCSDSSTQTAAQQDSTEHPAIPDETAPAPSGNPLLGQVMPSPMVLRRRREDIPANFLREDNFSDSEEFQPNPVQERFRRCRMCHRNVGRYALIPCGAFPTCGACIKEWYVNISGAPCPHFRHRVTGWTKVFNQH